MKLTVALKEKIAVDAVRDLFIGPLLKQFSDVQAKIEDLVKDNYSGFDFKNAEPYREFINWHEEIKIPNMPEGWDINWRAFKNVFKLPSVEYFKLPFKIPAREDYVPYLAKTYHKTAVEILRPYMVNYLAAEEAYDKITQVLLGISTSRQLEELLPELVKYLPDTANGAVAAPVPVEQINRVRGLLKRKQEAANG